MKIEIIDRAGYTFMEKLNFLLLLKVAPYVKDS